MCSDMSKLLKIGDCIEITVDKAMQECYFPSHLHHSIGFIWQLDDEHIWIKTIRYDHETKKPYISGPDRYSWFDISIQCKDFFK